MRHRKKIEKENGAFYRLFEKKSVRALYVGMSSITQKNTRRLKTKKM
jgi:hypothetical protein